ncbi:NACHT domain-containing protein [Geodermatophilus sp. SYSU D00703]
MSPCPLQRSLASQVAVTLRVAAPTDHAAQPGRIAAPLVGSEQFQREVGEISVDYHFEQLGDERFQELCQAVLVAERDGIQCFPVGQPDGGRDVVQHFDSSNRAQRAFLVFQVKFVRRPDKLDSPHKWLLDVMSKEAPKLATLLPKGAVGYYLLTNVSGTAHPDVGSIDKLNKLLSDKMSLPTQVMWRDDLVARVNANSSIRWAFPEILRATDILEALMRLPSENEGQVRRLDAIRAFVTQQYESDEEVRFKQVDLQHDLTTLFVDVPAALRRGPGDRREKHLNSLLLESIKNRSAPNGSGISGLAEYEPSVGAAALLASKEGQRRFPRLVIEGGPGQGKSTLVQFVCQVHRMRLLNKAEELRQVAERHQPQGAKIPIRVDLREYAVWLGGVNPFATQESERIPSGSSRHLEGFISALVQDLSGGVSFDVADFRATLRESSIFLALDGLDEIANLARRQEVIREVTSAARRLSELNSELQLVITTRPSAFTGLTDFSSRLFQYVELIALDEDLVGEYSERWTRAKRLRGRDAAELRRTLQERMMQSHFRDLARNPMQLAILLSVVHTRGTSLPDKRTALYDIYVELFLARESEKDDAVRDNQELLIDLHRYVAWVLHSDAETATGMGRIDREALLRLLRDYLSAEGRSTSHADALFAGFQRVVFLVERVEGTFEFEVQPLREYFAARYLYDTSPYSPAGRERGGTMPDRFDGLARNPYWLNVTRFFGGCLSKGELPALVDRLRALMEDPEWEATGHPRALAASLLGDWVFSQNPRSMRTVIDLLLTYSGIRALMSNTPGGRESVVLPEGCGRQELVTAGFAALREKSIPADTRIQLGRVVQLNAERQRLRDDWVARFEGDDDQRLDWISVAYFTGVLAHLDDDYVRSQLATLSPRVAESLVSHLLVIGRSRPIENCPETQLAAFRQLASRGSELLRLRNSASALEAFGIAMSASMYATVFSSAPDSMTLASVVRRWMGGRDVKLAEGLSQGVNVPPYAREAIAAFERGSRQPLGEWRRSVSLWSAVVEPVRAEMGDEWSLLRLAILASGVKEMPGRGADVGLFDTSVALSERARLARHYSGRPGWWREQLAGARSDNDKSFIVGLGLLATGPRTLAALAGDLTDVVAGLSVGRCMAIEQVLRSSLQPPIGFGGPRPRRLHGEGLPDLLHPRVVALIASVLDSRAQEHLYTRYLEDYRGSDELVLTFCADSMARRIQRDGQDATWLRMLDLLRLTQPRNIWWRGVSGRSETDMPVGIARLITGNRDEYPQELVAAAERRNEQVLLSRLEPLATTAAREGWFEDGQGEV